MPFGTADISNASLNWSLDDDDLGGSICKRRIATDDKRKERREGDFTDRSSRLGPYTSCSINGFVKVVAQAVRCDDEKHLKRLTVPFIDAPIGNRHAP